MPRGIPKVIQNADPAPDASHYIEKIGGNVAAGKAVCLAHWYFHSICDESMEDYPPEFLLGMATDEQIQEDFMVWAEHFLPGQEDLEGVDVLEALKAVLEIYSLGEDYKEEI